MTELTIDGSSSTLDGEGTRACRTSVTVGLLEVHKVSLLRSTSTLDGWAPIRSLEWSFNELRQKGSQAGHLTVQCTRNYVLTQRMPNSYAGCSSLVVYTGPLSTWHSSNGSHRTPPVYTDVLKVGHHSASQGNCPEKHPSGAVMEMLLAEIYWSTKEMRNTKVKNSYSMHHSLLSIDYSTSKS